MAKRETTQLKWKKKKWIEVVAPAIFKNASLGEALAEDGQQLVGKVIQANMMNVVRSARMQSITMSFKVTEVKNGQATTEATSYLMAPSAIKRLVRARRDRIDDSFVVQAKDGKTMRVKPLLITQANNSAGQQTAVRLAVRDTVCEYVAERATEDIIVGIVDGELQKMIKEAATKIVPIRSVDIRAFELVTGAKNIAVAREKQAVEEPVVEETQEA